MQYIKEIQSGEFLELSKLVPKSLLLYDEGNNLVLSLENSVVKVLRKSKLMASTSIANTEQWTTASCLTQEGECADPQVPNPITGNSAVC